MISKINYKTKLGLFILVCPIQPLVNIKLTVFLRGSYNKQGLQDRYPKWSLLNSFFLRTEINSFSMIFHQNVLNLAASGYK